MRKLVLLLLFILNLYNYTCAQNYYWSQGEKIYLTIDSTHLVVSKDVANNIVIQQKKQVSYDILKVKDILSSNLSSIKSALPISKKTFNLSDNIPTCYSYILNGNEITPTGKILLLLNTGNDLKDIEKFIIGPYTVENIFEKGTIIISLSEWDKCIETANAIYESGKVKWCHPDFQIPIHLNQIIDALYPYQYYLKNNINGIDINVEKVWAFAKGNNIRVAVIDDGVEKHSELGERLLDGYTPNTLGNGQPTSTNSGHGQCCAGIIAATHNNSNIAGIAPLSKIVPINPFHDGSISSFVQAIEYAWNPSKGKSDIISNSWGGRVVADAITTEIANARTYGRNGKGCIVVFSSGNSNDDKNVMFPAKVEGVMTVGAITRQGNIWYYSCGGPELEVVAPSGDVNNKGDIYTIDRTGYAGYTNKDYTDSFGGTSAACPQVAGVAALLLSIDQNLSTEQINSIICSTCTKLTGYAFTNSNAHPYGTWNNEVGYGLINAYEAIKKAMDIKLVGPRRICNANTSYNYELKNLPTEAIVSWKSSKYSIIPNSINSHNASIKTGMIGVYGSGTFKVTATFIHNGLTDSISCTTTYGSEPPVIQVYDYVTNLPIKRGQFGVLYYAKIVEDASQNPNDYTWSIQPKFGTLTRTTYTNDLRFNIIVDEPGEYLVSLNYKSYCGSHLVSTDFWLDAPVAPNPPVIISPNPASSEIEIELKTPHELETHHAFQPKRGIKHIRIYSQQGILKLEKNYSNKENKTTLSTSQLPSGTYIVHIYDSSKWIQQKLIIQK